MAAGAAGDDRAAEHAAHRRQIVGYYRQAVGDRRRRAVRDQDYPLTFSGADDAGGDPAHRRRAAVVRDAQARGLAGPGRSRRCAPSSTEGQMRHVSILCGNNGLFLDYEMERGADGAKHRLRVSRTCCATWSGSRPPGSASNCATSSTPTCRCCATSSSPASGSPCKYVLMRRRLLASAAQRQPTGIADAARGRVDHLLARLARHDPRLQPSAPQAERRVPRWTPADRAASLLRRLAPSDRREPLLRRPRRRAPAARAGGARRRSHARWRDHVAALRRARLARRAGDRVAVTPRVHSSRSPRRRAC